MATNVSTSSIEHPFTSPTKAIETAITRKSDPNNLANSLQPSSKNFQTLKSYPFAADAEFKLGLGAILGHSGNPATADEVNRTDDLVIKAKCFYYSRKFAIQPPIDFSAYKRWLRSSSPILCAAPENVSSPGSSRTAPAKALPISSPTEQPAYPSSFSHIVELITTGQPIPGIQQIPDIVLRGQEGPSSAMPRRKPWEKEAEKDEAAEGAKRVDFAVVVAAKTRKNEGQMCGVVVDMDGPV